MFSVNQKRQIADAVQKILRDTGHPELPVGEIQFHLHVEGAESWSWADIRNNGVVAAPSINPWNELQASNCAPQVEETSMAEKSSPAPFRNFGGMCWPVPCERLDEAEWCLRYQDKACPLSMEDRLLAASVIAAYRDLVGSTNTRRNAISCELRKGPGIADDVHPTSGKDYPQ